MRRIKAGLGTSFYREYLRRLLPRLVDGDAEGPFEEPVDYLALSSSVIVEIASEHHEGDLPFWCRTVTADEQRRGRHDKIREDLRQLLSSKGAT